MRAGLALCPNGVPNPSSGLVNPRIFVLLVGPVDQNHLHLNLLVSISSLLHSKKLVTELTLCGDPQRALELLQRAEGLLPEPGPAKRVWSGVQSFVGRRFGFGAA